MHPLTDEELHLIFGQVPYLESVAVWNPEAEKLTIFAVNRNLDQGVSLIGDLRDFEDYRIMSHTILEHENLKAFNSFDHPDEVKPHTYSGIEVKKWATGRRFTQSFLEYCLTRTEQTLNSVTNLAPE